MGLLCGSAGKESACNAACKPGFDPWVGKIPWRRERLLNPVTFTFTFQTLNPIGLSVVSSSVLFQIQQNWYFPAVVLEETLENLFDSKEIKPVNPKWNQPWIFIGETDDKAEAPIFWLSDAKDWFIGKDWCWERLRARRRGADRGWDGWMTSPI